jgi:hypothetical protein
MSSPHFPQNSLFSGTAVAHDGQSLNWLSSPAQLFNHGKIASAIVQRNLSHCRFDKLTNVVESRTMSRYRLAPRRMIANPEVDVGTTDV